MSLGGETIELLKEGGMVYSGLRTQKINPKIVLAFSRSLGTKIKPKSFEKGHKKFIKIKNQHPDKARPEVPRVSGSAKWGVSHEYFA